MEWLEDYEEVDPQHRHVSHLYGLHPGNQISPTLTPELAQACRETLNRRGDEATGWSRAWKQNFWARLGDGNRAQRRSVARGDLVGDWVLIEKGLKVGERVVADGAHKAKRGMTIEAAK